MADVDGLSAMVTGSGNGIGRALAARFAKAANAGAVGGTGNYSPEAARRRAWELNVMAHVRAGQALLPSWLQRAVAGLP